MLHYDVNADADADPNLKEIQKNCLFDCKINAGSNMKVTGTLEYIARALFLGTKKLVRASTTVCDGEEGN